MKSKLAVSMIRGPLREGRPLPASALVLCVALGFHLARAAQSQGPAPAKVENAAKETELATIQLTPQAEQRLGIVLAQSALKRVAVTRLFGGDMMVPLAPADQTSTGYFPLGSATPEELLRISDQQAAADGEIEKAKVQLDAAQVTLKRAETLVRDEAGSVRSVDDATAQVRLAEQGLAVARTRRALLGAPVAEALQGRRLWIRVPVYAGELGLVDTQKEARVSGLGARPGDATLPARPAKAPPSANPAAATVDLFYELEGTGSAFRPGQRVTVSLPLRGEAERLVVPWAAVLHDIHGNTWVYENTAPQTFVRRRVQVLRVAGQDAVLASGPKPGTKVVTDGAAELFGTEFGGGK